MQTTMLEAPTTVIALTTVSTHHTDSNCRERSPPAMHTSDTDNADNDIRSTNHDDNTDPCNNLSTLTTMQTTMLEATITVIALTTAPTTAH